MSGPIQFTDVIVPWFRLGNPGLCCEAAWGRYTRPGDQLNGTFYLAGLQHLCGLSARHGGDRLDVRAGPAQRGEYFLAGRSMGSLVIAMTMLAASSPGSASWLPRQKLTRTARLLPGQPRFFIATPITTIFFLPLFYQSRFFTAYQYLEERFSVEVRTLASASFILRCCFGCTGHLRAGVGAGASDRPALVVHHSVHGCAHHLLHDAGV